MWKKYRTEQIGKKIRKEGFPGKKIDCQMETNIANLKVEDILILISNALIVVCNEKEEKIRESQSIDIHAGIGAGFSKIIKLIAEVKSQIMNTSEMIITIREKLIARFGEWNVCIDNIIEKIKEEDGQKYSIIIFENFDRILSPLVCRTTQNIFPMIDVKTQDGKKKKQDILPKKK